MYLEILMYLEIFNFYRKYNQISPNSYFNLRIWDDQILMTFYQRLYS
jgi:hypothetical protein